MKKTIALLLLVVIAGFIPVSCVKDVVTYCPFCGQSNITEISEYDKNTGKTELYYECKNSNCGRKFGAGKM
jgi:ribosomal protein L44E